MEGGKYRQKGFKTRTAADEWAEKREKEAAEFGSAINLTIAERSAVIDNRGRLERLNLTLQDAIAFAISYHEKAIKSCSIEELFERVIYTREKAGLSEGHLNGLRNRLGRFQEEFKGFSVSSIERHHVEQWLHKLAKDFHPRTVNHHRTAIVLAFNDAVETGFIEKNPAERVRPMKVVEADTEILSCSQIVELLKVADSSILPAFAIGAFAGVRDSEIKKLRWEDINFQTGAIHVRGKNAKSAKNRHVDISENLSKWIKPLAKASGPVWPVNGRKLHDQAKLDAGFANPDRLTEKQKESRTSWQQWPKNGLRHSYASYHLAHFKQAAELALNLGHRDTGLIFAHYRALVTAEDAAKYWAIAPQERGNIISIAS